MMKSVGIALIRMIAQLFRFYWPALAIAVLLIQSPWIDMRFSSAYIITVMMGLGLWLSLLFLLSEGRIPSFFGNRTVSTVVIGVSVAIVAVVTIMNGTAFIMPAYLTGKAWFLGHFVPATMMNIVLLVWIFVGSVALFYSRDSGNIASPRKSFTPSQKTGIYVFSGVAAVFVLLYLGQGSFQRTISDAVYVMQQADVAAFREYLLSFGPLAAVVSGFLMVFQAIVAPLPAFVITFANGLVFGWLWGAVLSWSSAMVGAVLCFYLAKWVGRPVVERWVSRKALSWWDGFFDRYGSYSILIARLVPIVSFDLVSYAAGVTPITFWNFFWATGLGQLPATLLYSYLGETATGVVQILFLLFTIVIALGIIGFLLKPRFQHFKNGKIDK